MGIAYSQHRKYFCDKGLDVFPVQKFQDDLTKQIKSWMKQKNKIILLIDANGDVRSGRLSQKLENIGLILAIRSKHGHRGPATQHKGSHPIDDIFLSRGIQVSRAGYLPFCDGPGDHRALYADIDFNSLFDGDFLQIHRQPARRLIPTNPTVVEKLNKLFDEKLEEHRVHERMEKLRLEACTPLTPAQILEYEKCDRIQCNAFKYADKRCRKLRAGEVCYSREEIQRYGMIIRLCTYLIRKNTSVKLALL